MSVTPPHGTPQSIVTLRTPAHGGRQEFWVVESMDEIRALILSNELVSLTSWSVSGTEVFVTRSDNIANIELYT